jgi:lipoprotein-anchoring transpeptidase ErfK/SrfK
MTPSHPAVPRASGPRRRLTASAIVALTVGSSLLSPAHAVAVPQQQALVRLLQDHVARAAPSTRARKVAVIDKDRPLTHVATVLPELARRVGRNWRVWVHVALPGRPNGSKGWIRATRTRRTTTPWRITVDLSTRHVRVHHFGRLARRFRAVVGAASTPTPRGRFFIEEALALDAGAHGGPYALATSARSTVLQEFDGGPGQIALHGRNGLYEPLGTASSHGCVRLSARAITWLSRRIGAGVPLTVRP